MACKRKDSAIAAIGENVKRAKLEYDNGDGNNENKNNDLQLMPYNDSGYSVEQDQSGMVCIFKPIAGNGSGDNVELRASRKVTWLDKMIYNLKINNSTVINCNHSDAKYLKSGLDYLSSLYSMHDWHSRLYPEIDKNIVIVEPMGSKTTYAIGARVKGKPSGFGFVDFGKLKRAKSNFGHFFSIQWNNIHYFNKIFGNIMEKYFKDDFPFKMEPNACIHLSEKANEREILLRKFYNITRENNMRIYATGELDRPVEVERTTMEQFDEMFEMNNADGPYQEVEVLICGVIEGVKYGKETQMTDINNKKYTEKPYSLAFKPILFFNIEQ
ncbi:dbp [Catopsilia pomona nucleopolyhedrovirus]|uniref:Dbp n=1 Tax=Catopsilia pomona nucleopolyhedrovirus TaxID=1850906 RepID=A0A172WZI9_9ABAC|nr:dbp [Catopsilia pomona nucleopolyhedrovirus]ANF29760.1 dbp [Catopsilia pomona nucleopolyhedrovirus]